MSTTARAKTLLGNAVGYGLLVFALIAASYGVFTVAVAAVDGLSTGLVSGALFSFGTAVFCGFVGVTVRKAVAGTVLPLDVDTDEWRMTMFRGGQGG